MQLIYCDATTRVVSESLDAKTNGNSNSATDQILFCSLVDNHDAIQFSYMTGHVHSSMHSEYTYVNNSGGV